MCVLESQNHFPLQLQLWFYVLSISAWQVACQICDARQIIAKETILESFGNYYLKFILWFEPIYANNKKKSIKMLFYFIIF